MPKLAVSRSDLAETAALPDEDAGRLPNSERAYRGLKQLIMTNALPAGAQLLELEAAARLGMSRTPVREAMVRLAQEGIVEIRPRHGMRILPVSADDMREIYEILTALESEAAAIVARRGLTPAQDIEIKGALAAMETALKIDDLVAWSLADRHFHAALVTFAGNRRLGAIVEQVSDQAHRARMLTLKLRPPPVQSHKDHAALVAAIVARDPDTARRIHEEHRRHAGAMLVELIRNLGLGQL